MKTKKLNPKKKMSFVFKHRVLLISAALLLILCLISYKLIYPLIFKPSTIALVGQQAAESNTICDSNVASLVMSGQCGHGEFRKYEFTCKNDYRVRVELATNNACLNPVNAYKTAHANCGQTCYLPSPSPSPSSSPSPFPSPSLFPSPSPKPSFYPSPSPSASKGYYRITNHPNPVNITCTEGDINCGFYLPVIYQNTTNQDLYETVFWAGTPGIKFLNPATGQLTDQAVVLKNPIFFEPGYGPNMLVAAKVTSDLKPGIHVRRLYVDAKTCNQIGDKLDCYYGGSYGVTTFTINLTIVPRTTPTAIPSASPYPTTTSIPRPSLTPTPKPTSTSISTSTPIPTVFTNSTTLPVAETSKSTTTKPSYNTCFNSCRQQGGKWYSCVQRCLFR